MELEGFITALYLFDVAEAIDLGALKARFGERASAARLDDKAAGPPKLRYLQAPMLLDGAAIGCAEIDGFRVRVKLYDYGVISLMLFRPFTGRWPDLVRLGTSLVESEPLEAHAAATCRRIAADVAPALREPRVEFLSEDYLVFAVTSARADAAADPGPAAVEGPVTDVPAMDLAPTADELLRAHGADLAQLLRGERQPLSGQEREEVLRHRLSYLADDLVVPAWNATFIYDSEPATLATIEILEYANSQLLEFRYYDDLLERQLTRIYTELQRPRPFDRVVGRRHARAARELQALFIDVNDLTDRMQNAVKFVGDIYAARLFGAVAGRLGLDRWRQNVEEKLTTLNDIHRFAVEQTGMSQGNILELVIVLILVLELALLLMGIMT